jgi:CheY-like chemotaxis protein
VDDNEDDVTVLRYALIRNGFANPFHAVDNGEEALLYLQGTGKYSNRELFPMPYLLLLDINMPGPSGWDVLRWVRGRPELAPLIVLMLGGNGTEFEHEMANRLGANGYYTKVFDQRQFNDLSARIGEFWLLGRHAA